MNSIPILQNSKIVGYVVTADEVEKTLFAGPNLWCIKVSELHASGKILAYSIVPYQKGTISFHESPPIDEKYLYGPSELEEVLFGDASSKHVSKVDDAMNRGIVMYGIGYEDATGGYGMIDGPTPNINDMLSSYGSTGACIVQLTGNIKNDVVLYRWDDSKLIWNDVRKQKTYTVKLTYFKRTGKYYTSGEFESPEKTLSEIWEDIKKMTSEGNWPGLVDGQHDFIIHIEVPGHPHDHPKLMIPPRSAD